MMLSVLLAFCCSLYAQCHQLCWPFNILTLRKLDPKNTSVDLVHCATDPAHSLCASNTACHPPKLEQRSGSPVWFWKSTRFELQPCRVGLSRSDMLLQDLKFGAAHHAAVWCMYKHVRRRRWPRAVTSFTI